MPSDNDLRKEGIVTEALRNAIFRVELTTGEEVLGSFIWQTSPSSY